MSVSSPLRLFLLGSFQMESHKGLVHLPTRKAESLLAYLALNPEAHAREKLAALFWGDRIDRQARTSLRTAIGALRRQVGDELLLADRETVQLNPAFPLWVDAKEFRMAEIKLRNTDSSRQSEIHNLQSAIDLYRGDLLADFYDDWIAPEREHYRTLYLDALLHLVQTFRSAGEYERARAFAQRVLASDRANEQAHQHLMFCYFAIGNRNAALRQYEQCERVLREELGVDPAPETTALYRQIEKSSPPTRADEALLTNLPLPMTSFIGRRRELVELKDLIVGHRFVTLTGVGGSGKTRLAIQVARQVVEPFTDGVWWVDLTGVNEGALVPQSVAHTLGVRERPQERLVETLSQYLYSKRVLLVFDNCEHLLTACAQLVGHLLATCPELHILATSRKALSVTSEKAWRVPQLSLPAPWQLLAGEAGIIAILPQYEAVQLFLERAHAIRSDLELTEQNARAVAQVCQRLDGIPLAIELAAAQATLLTVEQIAARLEKRFSALALEKPAALPRHQTLRATVDWSYNLVSEKERLLFRRLSVFAGGFTLEAAERVAPDELEEAYVRPKHSSHRPRGAAGLDTPDVFDLLSRLVDKSLAVTEPQREQMRYRLLEPIREYAFEKLQESGEAEAARQKHERYFLVLAEEAEFKLNTTDETFWADRLEVELGNLRAALRWSVESEDSVSGLRIGGALARFWGARGYRTEGREHLARVLAMPGAQARTEWRARALFGAGILALHQADYAAAVPLLEESAALWRDVGNRQAHANALIELGVAARWQGNHSEGERLFEQSASLFRELGDAQGLSRALSFLGHAAFSRGAHATARALYEESISMARELGPPGKGIVANALRSLGVLTLEQGDYASARAMLAECMQLWAEVKDKAGLAILLAHFGSLKAAEHDFKGAARLFGAAEVLREATETGVFPFMRALYEQSLALTRTNLSQEAFEREWERGRAMKLEETIAYALSDPVEQPS